MCEISMGNERHPYSPEAATSDHQVPATTLRQSHQYRETTNKLQTLTHLQETLEDREAVQGSPTAGNNLGSPDRFSELQR
jgi:hypothetical protein